MSNFCDELQERIDELQDRIDCMEEWEGIQDELDDLRDKLDDLEYDRDLYDDHDDWRHWFGSGFIYARINLNQYIG